jgi:stress-induced-phosphoprotein 1
MSAAEFKAKGNQYLQSGDYDQAIEAYTQAIQLDSKDHVFYSNRSAAYLSKGDALSALSDAEKCIEISPQWPKGYSRKGAALHSLKRYDEGLAAYESGLKIAPTDSGLKSGLEELKKAQSSSHNDNGFGGGAFFPPQLLAKLAAHPKFGPKLADPVFMAKLRMIQSNPQLMLQDPEVMEIFSLLIGSEDAENNSDTGPSYAKAAASKPTPPPAPAPEPELSEAERAVKTKKQSAVAAKDRGNALYKEKKFDEAIAAYDEAIALDPSNILFLSNKAAVYIEMNEPDRAIQLCQEAIDIGRSHRVSYEDIAKVYQRQAAAALKKDDIGLAIEYYGKSQMENFDKAIERKIKNLELDLKKKQTKAFINPELGLVAKERGNAAFREGNFPEAIKDYEEATKRDPTNASYRNNLAAALLKVGDFNGAKNQVEKSLEIDPNYVKAWAKKGDIEFFMKEYHKAMDSYRTGLKLDPTNTLCRDGLTKVVAKVNTSSESDSERQAHAMADPEIQAILSDPMIRQVIQDLSENPKYGQLAMQDPVVRAKIEKLIASGVLQVK